MKILAIRGKNLASLEGEFAIEFREEPLLSSGVFAITGPTGAGKSTILDAMCAALYCEIPRFGNIKNKSAIEIHGKKSVFEDDAKTILRRGTCEGYAEVDFKAVDGYEYRARWWVARTSKNPNGNFRDMSHELTNLTTGDYSNLKISEYKNRLVELTGLTFEQFTRSVLLAQGNFAAFLKADETEKATILQTLTGTEIYSRISELIYNKYVDAKKILEVIEEKRHALALMTSEELEALKEQKSLLLQKQEAAGKELQTLMAKKDWIERSVQLVTLLDKAVQEQALSIKLLDEAKPRIEWLEKVDSIQNIRDTYISLCNSERMCIESSNEIVRIAKEYDTMNSVFEKANTAVTEATAFQERVNKEWLSLQPRLMKAAKLEEQVAIEVKREKEVKGEVRELEKELAANKRIINNTNSQITILKGRLNEISEWYTVYKEYESAIPYIPSIIVNITSARNDIKLAEIKNKQLENASSLLEINIRSLDDARKRKERLEHTLASEIAVLRERLVEGEPCPVCGSRHHELGEEILDILGEKELEKEKNEIKKLLEHLEKSVENYRNEIAVLNGAIMFHRTSAQNLMNRCAELMPDIRNVTELLERSDICNILNDIRVRWTENKKDEGMINEELLVKSNLLEVTAKRNDEIDNELSVKRALLVSLSENVDKGKNEIIAILEDSTSTKALQERYNLLVANANKAFSDAMKSKIEAAEVCNRLKGQLVEKRKTFQDEKLRMEKFGDDIRMYLAKRNDMMTFECLKDIFSITPTEITALRNDIDKLKKAVATANATRKERERNIVEHEKAPIKPRDNEDCSTLQNAIEEVNREGRYIIEELSNINATLLKDEENNRLFSEYKREYEKKLEIATNWNTLNEMFGSANGSKLKRLAQGYTLDILLEVANHHLKEITERYELARISERSLGIKVIDLDMLSESRSVHSLSGGETFLVSLALSLALSSISSNRMSIESLFIDEGFGALDSDTLKTAMRALERLQSQGRKIGVISHLSEMLEQIHVKISVTKRNSGKSRIEIIEG